MTHLQPQNLEAEKAVLGVILMERTGYDRAAEILKPECFYLPKHQNIFTAARNLSDRHQPIDQVTVWAEMTRLGLTEGMTLYDFTEITNSSTGTGLESYSKIILEKFLKRQMLEMAANIIRDGYDDTVDVFEMMDGVEESFSKIGDNLSMGDMIGIDRVMMETVNQIHDWKEQGGKVVTGIPTGFSKLDSATRGWQDTNLVYIAARPSVGKTAFSLALIRAAAEVKTVAVWSLEMSRVQLGLRMLSAESETMLSKLQTGKVNDQELTGAVQAASERIGGLRIHLDDTAGLTIQKLRSKARKLKRKNNLGIIFIDYLQLMTGDTKGNREQEVAKISRSLKLLAKELEIPIIALAQLSREVEKRAGGIPQLSDLRESGSIEQDADVVIMLYGESETAINDDPAKEFVKHAKIAKQRDGMLVTVPLHFYRYIQKFTEGEEQKGWKPLTTIPHPDTFHGGRALGEDDKPF